jgi:predicted flavoprotein YhiN
MRIAIVGGGAAGFFAAITCAEANRANEIAIYERSGKPLHKVRVSGGGRCNVTHALFDVREFTNRYPRGERELIAPLHRFDASDTVAWFEARGIRLKTEPDGRIFPVTDSSATIVDCLMHAAESAGVKLFTRRAIGRVDRADNGEFILHPVATVADRDPRHPPVAAVADRGAGDASETPVAAIEPTQAAADGRGYSGTVICDRLLLATGGARNAAGAKLAESLGHTIAPPVPSLFTLQTQTGWVRALPGVSVADVELSVADTKLRERGALLITHEGLSGPVVLRLSAWGARELHAFDYRFNLRINWLPDRREPDVHAHFGTQRAEHPNRLVMNSPIAPLPARLWEQLALAVGLTSETKWTNLPRAQANALAAALLRTEVAIDGQSLNKEEFVTCGGVRLREVSFKTMESRLVPHLYFAGELLDIDGITGGFNFQSAWTTGWIAGHAMAGVEPKTIS